MSAITIPPLWRESRLGFEVARLVRHPVWKGEGVEDGGGQPVMLVPGFLAGDDTLGLMTRWLRRTGHHTCSARMRMNVDCSEAAVGRLEERAEALFERHGQRVAIIGQSRGGCLARVVARRRPDLIGGVIGLGSPFTDQFAIHPLVRLQVYAVGLLGTLGYPGLFKHSCLAGDCCERYRDDVQARFPKNVGFLSLYSKSDGVVNWRSCLDPAAKHHEIHASHIGMGLNPEAYVEIAGALARFRAADAPAKPRRSATRLKRAA